jgi:hypothetical protein
MYFAPFRPKEAHCRAPIEHETPASVSMPCAVLCAVLALRMRHKGPRARGKSAWELKGTRAALTLAALPLAAI